MNEFIRVATVSPLVKIGAPHLNAENILKYSKKLQAQIIVFPELCVTGYTCGDLFKRTDLLDAAEQATVKIAKDFDTQSSLIFVGVPIRIKNELFNCAVAICQNKIIGIVPKQNIPNYNEFYESRWFRAGDGDEPQEVEYGGQKVPFGTDLMFKLDKETFVHAEICEDLWMPIPPSSYAAIAGANVLVNLSASNETVGKEDYRFELVKNQSARCMAAYLYASAGPTESTSDLVFSGSCIIAENNNILASCSALTNINKEDCCTADLDIEKLQYDRRSTTTFGESTKTAKAFRIIDTKVNFANLTPQRKINGLPFVPQNPQELNKRCEQIWNLQSTGLEMRIKNIKENTGNIPDLYIGVSGGLDSTLALLVAVKACRNLNISTKKIHGITMPGFGTTLKTKNNALNLMNLLDITKEDEIDIRPACIEQFKAIKHNPFGIQLNYDQNNSTLIDGLEVALKAIPKSQRHDLTFENVQARQRTMILMSKGFVIGTGDLSELALGWCTYNGDHMSMYNPNCSVPKTLVKFLVQHIANNYNGCLCEEDRSQYLLHNLMDISNTTVSPELLPTSANGDIEQSTEDVLGPYILHDFYLYNFVRNGFSYEKILYLSQYADFGCTFSQETITKTLNTFMSRFFANQYKRNCVPDGVKIGSVSLSPRGDWRMPSDCNPSLWINKQNDY